MALDVNQPLGEKGAVPLNALWNDPRFYQHHALAESQRLRLAAKYRFTPEWQARLREPGCRYCARHLAALGREDGLWDRTHAL